jgi:hypothetical protein
MGGSLTSFDAGKKSSRWIFWLVLIIAALFVVLSIRYGFQEYGEEDGDTQQSSNNQTNRSSAAEATNAGNSVNAQSPFSGAFFSDDYAIPVTFKGVVLNQEDRSPVKGARVRILALASPSETLEKTTGGDGAFTMDAPAAYRYELNVEAEGFSRYSNNSFIITRSDYSLEILLAPRLALKGRVVDLQSQGIPGAMVGIFLEEEQPSILTVADVQGKFSFNLPKGVRFQVDAFHAGYDSLGKANATTSVEEELVLRMKPSTGTGAIVGTVSDTGLKPIAGAKLSLFDLTAGNKVSEVTTDQKGEYRIFRVREGAYLMSCTADGFPQANNSQSMVRINSGKESRLDFSLRAGQQIRGIVINQKGEPVANAYVQCRSMRISPGRGMRGGDIRGGDMRGGGMRGGRFDNAREGQPFASSVGIASTDTKGMFQILGLTEGEYQINIQHRDYLDFSASIQTSNQQQTLTLDSAISVRGAVRTMQGATIERFSIYFESMSMTNRFSKSYDFATSDGYFDVRGLPRDKYMVALTVRDSDRYSGTLDLQSSMQVILMIGEKPDLVDEFRGGRGGGFGGGRGGGPIRGPGNRGRGSEANSLTIIAKQ